MANIKWICNHCGHRFEAEEKPDMACLSCFWSSSLVKESDQSHILSSVNSAKTEKKFTTAIPAKKFSAGVFLPWIKAGILLLVIALFLFAASRTLQPQMKGMEDWWSAKTQKINLKPNWNLPGTAKEEKKENLQAPAGAAPAAQLISAEEKKILETPLILDAHRAPSSEELALLKRQVPLKTGVVESLPSPAWTLDRFKKFLDEQQRFYRVPLPGSYQRKLEKLFERNAVPAQAAFEKNDFLQARDLWVASLAFPIYSNNIQKHRGVALTMMRPLINDTLSKIGALNGILFSQNERELEIQLSQEYQKLFSSIEAKSWSEALAHIHESEALMQKIVQSQKSKSPLPSYPAAIAQVDEGIQAALAQLLNPSPASQGDFNALLQDLTVKSMVLNGFTEEGLKQAYQKYNEAMEQIKVENWANAEKLLREIQYPLELIQDAKAKQLVLKKLQTASLEPSDENPSQQQKG